MFWAVAVQTLEFPLLSAFLPMPSRAELNKVFSFVLVIIFLTNAYLKRKKKRRKKEAKCRMIFLTVLQNIINQQNLMSLSFFFF